LDEEKQAIKIQNLKDSFVFHKKRETFENQKWKINLVWRIVDGWDDFVVVFVTEIKSFH